MTVIDASAVIHVLVGDNPSSDLLMKFADDLEAPHLLDVEVTSALRGMVLGRKISEESALLALRDFSALNISRFNVEPLLDRVWALKNQFTAYDATYLALSERIERPLVTCDVKLDTSGHNAEVIVFRS